MAKRVKIVRVPGTTANIIKGIVNFLLSKGHFVYPTPTVGIWDEKKKAYRRAGKRGGPDITGCLHYAKTLGGVGGITRFNCGLYLAIEVKNPATRDRVRKAQQEFAQEVKSAGGLYIITPSVESLINWYNNNMENDVDDIKVLSN